MGCPQVQASVIGMKIQYKRSKTKRQARGIIVRFAMRTVIRNETKGAGSGAGSYYLLIAAKETQLFTVNGSPEPFWTVQESRPT